MGGRAVSLCADSSSGCPPLIKQGASGRSARPDWAHAVVTVNGKVLRGESGPLVELWRDCAVGQNICTPLEVALHLHWDLQWYIYSTYNATTRRRHEHE